MQITTTRSDLRPPVVTIEASLHNLAQLGDCIDKRRNIALPSFQCDDPKLYSLNEFHVVELPGDSPLRMAVAGLQLVAEGGAKALDWLASYFADLSVSENFYHVHIEWYEEHPYLAENSAPLIVSEIG